MVEGDAERIGWSDTERINSLGTSGSAARLICSERPTAVSDKRRGLAEGNGGSLLGFSFVFSLVKMMVMVH